MLTRFRLRRDFRVFARYLSDKPTENDDKVLENKQKHGKKPKEDSITNTKKIQDLLKLMMKESQVKEGAEEREAVLQVPERPRRRRERPDEIEVKTEKIEESLTKAASDVAQALGGDVKQTEAELLSKVLGKINQTSTSLSDLLIGMKVDRTKEEEEYKPESRGQQVKRMTANAQAEQNKTRYSQRKENERMKGREQRREPINRERSAPTVVDVSSGAPLGVLTSPAAARGDCGTRLDTWAALQARELALATAQPPANYYEKMILWTKQGKVWKFPINNEQGLEEENDVHFSEHVFMDAHLEGWCPTKGPIRHFMELVCVGLSKNAFYTVQEKRDHIMWYKEYFESRKSLLTEVGAWEFSAAPPQATA